MTDDDTPTLRLLRYALGGAIIGICTADILWYGDVTAQSLLAFIGFGIAYLAVREI